MGGGAPPPLLSEALRNLSASRRRVGFLMSCFHATMRPFFDVTPDGQRFVMIELGESPPALTQLVLVQNWGEELKRLVSTN